MKKLVLTCILLFVFIFLLVPMPSASRDGLYNPFSRLIWCRDQSACLHEIGHALDQGAGWPSHTRKFGIAAEVYVLYEFKSQHFSYLSERIVTLPGVLVWNGYFTDPQAEIYANIFQCSGGQIEHMPELFREFYDWERAKALIAALEQNESKSGYPLRMMTWLH